MIAQNGQKMRMNTLMGYVNHYRKYGRKADKGKEEEVSSPGEV
jgi:hypothetical protein